MSAKAFSSVKSTLRYQSDAVNHLYLQYQTDKFSQTNLLTSLQILFKTNQINRGKIVISGIGKSFKIANKLVATLNSLSIHATELHPSEALHGDLGIIDESKDCLILLTASGNTSELIQLLPHLSPDLPIILLTCNRNSKLSNHPQINSLLYTELPNYLNEESIHGLPAPTVSTTLSLILADATILALSEMIEQDLLKRKRQFSMKHPGGSIGSALSHLNDNLSSNPSSVGLKKTFSQFSTSSLLSLQGGNGQGNNNINGINSINSNSSSAIRKSISSDMKSNFSSLTSSDDEYDILELQQQDQGTCKPCIKSSNKRNIDQNLCDSIKASSPSKIKLLRSQEIWSLESKDELILLQWITIYDYLIINNKNSAIETSKAKQLYNDYYNELIIDETNKIDIWAKFHLNLMSSFKDIDL
ncbi:Polysialic acid capsule expression protein [Scheffersomyces amazonensis]|uniref:Polysialic acid capsule expression protein n=1 Tax=Scheffersomyces amazonensis TaxID=1078765 RepID=UPI00315DB853